MRKAFLRNLKGAGVLAGVHDTCRGLLAFYSVECGLKYLAMTTLGNRDSAYVATTYGHNIHKLMAFTRISAAELKLPVGSNPEIPKVRRVQNRNEIAVHELHTAWRYGVEIEPADGIAALLRLDALMAALRLRIESRGK